MPQFNTFSVAETAGRGRQEKQQEQSNALVMDAGMQSTSLTKPSNALITEWLAGASKYAIDNPGALGALVEEGKRHGIFAPEFNAASIDPKLFATDSPGGDGRPRWP